MRHVLLYVIVWIGHNSSISQSVFDCHCCHFLLPVCHWQYSCLSISPTLILHSYSSTCAYCLSVSWHSATYARVLDSVACCLSLDTPAVSCYLSFDISAVFLLAIMLHVYLWNSCPSCVHLLLLLPACISYFHHLLALPIYIRYSCHLDIWHSPGCLFSWYSFSSIVTGHSLLSVHIRHSSLSFMLPLWILRPKSSYGP